MAPKKKKNQQQKAASDETEPSQIESEPQHSSTEIQSQPAETSPDQDTPQQTTEPESEVVETAVPQLETEIQNDGQEPVEQADPAPETAPAPRVEQQSSEENMAVTHSERAEQEPDAEPQAGPEVVPEREEAVPPPAEVSDQADSPDESQKPPVEPPLDDEGEAPKILVSHDPTSPSEAHYSHHPTDEPHLSKIHVLELLEPVQEQVANIARATDDATTALNLRMDRLNVLLYEIRQEQSDAAVKSDESLHSATQHLTNLFVERLSAEQKTTETFVEALNKRIEECYDTLAEAQSKDTARLEKSVQESAANNANAVATHAELIQKQLDALVEQCNSTLGTLTQNMHELRTMVSAALTQEVLPPGPDIPEGPKIRLVVTFSVGKQSTDVMVPISLNATIGMVKREIIRRASRQNLVGDAVTYSNTILSLDGVVLFEDDTLEDVGISANERMTLGLVSSEALSSQSSVSAPPPKQASVAPAKLSPPATLNAPACAPSNSSASVRSSDSDRVVRSFFLDASTATSLADHESLDRRLMIEMARMELEPTAQQEKLERVGIVKTYVNKLRVTLLDRATYSHVESHRAIARSALEKLNDATARPTVSVEDLRGAQKLAEATLSSITSSDGERDRVDAMNESIRAESGKKSRLLQEIKDLIFEIRHRLRVPPEQLNRAEKVIDEGERAIILAPSMTSKELDAIHLLMVDFASGLKK